MLLVKLEELLAMLKKCSRARRVGDEASGSLKRRAICDLAW